MHSLICYIYGKEVQRIIQNPIVGKGIMIEEDSGIILESLGGCEMIYSILIGNKKVLAIDSSKIDMHAGPIIDAG